MNNMNLKGKKSGKLSKIQIYILHLTKIHIMYLKVKLNLPLILGYNNDTSYKNIISIQKKNFSITIK